MPYVDDPTQLSHVLIELAEGDIKQLETPTRLVPDVKKQAAMVGIVSMDAIPGETTETTIFTIPEENNEMAND